MISGRDLRCHGHLSLVSSGDDLVAANGRVQATYSAAQVAGPLLAGLLITVAPVPQVLWVDAASFLASEGMLGLIATPFNAPGTPKGGEPSARRCRDGSWISPVWGDASPGVPRPRLQAVPAAEGSGR